MGRDKISGFQIIKGGSDRLISHVLLCNKQFVINQEVKIIIFCVIFVIIVLLTLLWNMELKILQLALA